MTRPATTGAIASTEFKNAKRPDLARGEKQKSHLNDEVEEPDPDRNSPGHAAAWLRLIMGIIADENRSPDGPHQGEEDAEPLFRVRICTPPLIC